MKLPPSTICEFFRLRKVERKTFAEIAAKTGASERTVRRHLNGRRPDVAGEAGTGGAADGSGRSNLAVVAGK